MPNRVCYSIFMLKVNQKGAIGGEDISLVLTILLLIGTIAFGAWAFMGRQDYKNNSDAKVAAAVTQAKAAEDIVDNQKAAEAAKQPLKTYNGPEAYGSLQVDFQNTWIAYVDDSGGNDNSVIDAYFNPDVVPSITNQNSVFALRIQILNQTYSEVLQNLTNQNSDGGTPVTYAAYSLPKVPKSVGIRLTGSVQEGDGTKLVDMVVLPLRSDTIEIWTEGTQFGSDFNSNILPNLSFSP